MPPYVFSYQLYPFSSTKQAELADKTAATEQRLEESSELARGAVRRLQVTEAELEILRAKLESVKEQLDQMTARAEGAEAKATRLRQRLEETESALDGEKQAKLSALDKIHKEGLENTTGLRSQISLLEADKIRSEAVLKAKEDSIHQLEQQLDAHREKVRVNPVPVLIITRAAVHRVCS